VSISGSIRENMGDNLAKTDLISLLMSCYISDDPEHFDLALHSIATQTVLPGEFVLVCDGPLTDKHNNIIKKYETIFIDHGVDFKICKLSVNVGLGLALKAGAELCSKKYFMRMDSDDVSRKERVQRLLYAIAEYPDVDVLGAQINETNFTCPRLDRLREVPINEDKLIKFSRLRNPVNHVTAIIKRNSYELVGGYEGVRYFEDYFLWLKLLSSGCCIKNLQEVHVDVRVTELASRRIGLNYAVSEFKFISKAVLRGYVTICDGLKFCVVRLPTRFLTNRFYDMIMRAVRK
jgi:glycosyltransferase involved in cell wall biosynthesis